MLLATCAVVFALRRSRFALKPNILGPIQRCSRYGVPRTQREPSRGGGGVGGVADAYEMRGGGMREKDAQREREKEREIERGKCRVREKEEKTEQKLMLHYYYYLFRTALYDVRPVVV